MSQNYIITTDLNKTNPPVVTISNKSFEKSDISANTLLVSAGTVSFVKGQFSGVEASVTHGKLALNISVDLNQMSIDKKLIEELFL